MKKALRSGISLGPVLGLFSQSLGHFRIIFGPVLGHFRVNFGSISGQVWGCLNKHSDLKPFYKWVSPEEAPLLELALFQILIIFPSRKM